MFGLPRILTVYAVAIPLALVLGYFLSTPDQATYVMVGLVIFILTLPIFIRWHHILLIVFWNSAFTFPFLPAQPPFWMLLAGLSFGISWLNGLLAGAKSLRVPELTRPLLFLGLVVLVTGQLRGGIGSQIFGSATYGGKSYFYIFGAIIGYFALTAVRIPARKANRAARLFVVSGATFGLSNLSFLLGPAFYFLFYLLPDAFVVGQIEAASGMDPEAITRFNGASVACTALICYFLLRWGVRGVFSLVRPWRLVLFVGTALLSLLGGFRGNVVLLGLLIVCQFCIEGLWRTRFLAIVAGFVVLAGVMGFVYSDRLPLAAQRAICFLPVKVDPGVSADADGSVEWRLQMWRILVPEIPKYLALGKGYAIDPDELYFAQLDPGASAGVALVAGDYHSGPLSTIIPLGLGGVIGFLWLLGAGTSVLYKNYRYGDAALKRVNTFLLAYFITQAIFFFGAFGAFNAQLFLFTGILGLSVSFNGGVRKSSRAVPDRAAQAATMESLIPVQA